MSTESWKPVVLLVDDEPNILQGLRRILRSQRDVWELEFVEGGRAALNRLAAGPVDVVISDMRMPGIDGVQVLSEAARRYPDSVRFVLSGHAEKAAMLSAMACAHRYLSKPCDAATLIQAVEGALALRALLPQEALRRLVGSLKNVPVPSQRYFELIREIDDPMTSAKAVGESLEHDIALSTQILRLANSAYFGLSRRITRCRDAAEMLGLDTIKALLTLSEFHVTSSADPAIEAESRALADRSLQIGAYARRLALLQGLPRPVVDDAATAGLLCHVGTALLSLDQPHEFNRATDLAQNDNMQIVAAERQVFGASHAELGAYLVGLWGFPDSVVEAIAFHHDPAAAQSADAGVLASVHVAQALAGVSASGGLESGKEGAESNLFHGNARPTRLDTAFLEAVGMANMLPVPSQ